MSAQTGLEIPAAFWERFAALLGSTITLIKAGHRSPEMASRLLEAMQLLKENRLGRVLAIGQEEPQTPRDPRPMNESFRALRSHLLEDVDLPTSLRNYYGKRGVKYFGEIFTITPDPRSRIDLVLRDFCIERQIVVPDAPLDGWEPPYWTPETNRLLNTRAVLFLEKAANAHWRTWIPDGPGDPLLIGDIFEVRAFGKGKSQGARLDLMSGRLFEHFAHALQMNFTRTFPLHAAMLLPPRWRDSGRSDTG